MKKLVRRQKTKDFVEETDWEAQLVSKRIGWTAASTTWGGTSGNMERELEDDPRWMAATEDSGSEKSSSSDEEDIEEMSRKVEVLGNDVADGRTIAKAGKADVRAAGFHSVTCCCPTFPGSSLSLTFMSPFAFGADRPGFPTSTIIVLTVVVSIMVLVAS